jgi:hypothetical protein
MGNLAEFVAFASVGCVVLAMIGAGIEWAERKAKRKT